MVSSVVTMIIGVGVAVAVQTEVVLLVDVGLDGVWVGLGLLGLLELAPERLFQSDLAMETKYD